MRGFWAFLIAFLSAASLAKPADSCSVVGKKLFDENKFKEVVVAMQGCADRPSSLRILGMAYFRLGYMEEAKDCFGKALQQAPNDPDLKLQWANSCAWNKEFKKAIEEYQALLTAEPQNVGAKKGLAQTLGWSKKYTEAIVLYEDVVRKNPTDYESWIQIGVLKSWSRKFDEAAVVFRSVVAASPPQPWKADARFRLAEVLSWQRKFDLAETEYLGLLKQEPRYEDAYLGLGEMYEWQGKYKKAIAQYQQVLQVNPLNRKAKARLTQLMWVK